MSNHYQRILASAPVNKQSAKVISNCTEAETELQAMVKRVHFLTDAIQSAKKTKALPKSEIKRLGLELKSTEQKITELKGITKKERLKGNIGFYFIEVCRENMHNLEFKRYLAMAIKMRETAENINNQQEAEHGN